MQFRRGVSRTALIAGVVIIVLIAVAGAFVLGNRSSSTTSTTSSSSTSSAAGGSSSASSSGVSSTTSSSTSKTTPIVKGSLTLGTFSSGGAANLANAGQSAEWLAEDLPFFAQNGLNVTIDGLQSSTVILQALQSGSINIGDMAATEPVKLTALHEANFTAIMGVGADDCYSCTGGFFLAVSNSITNIDQLKGANIGISAVGGSDQLSLIYVLTDLGVNFNPTTGINWVAVGTPAARLAGMQAGTLQGTVTTTQNLAGVEALPNAHILINSSQFAAAEPPAVPGLIVQTSFLQSHTALLQEFVTSLIEANRAFASNESLWVQDAMKAMPSDNASVLQGIYAGYAHGFSINGGINMTSATRGIQYYYTTTEYINETVPTITAQQFVNTTLVDNTLNMLGVSSAFDIPNPSVATATTTTGMPYAILPLRYLEGEVVGVHANR